MRNWLFFLLILFLGILELTCLDYFKIFNLKPDLLLVGMVSASLFLEPFAAVLLSLFAGIIKDLSASNPFGINTLLFVLWSFLILKLNRKISLERNSLRLALVFNVAFLHNTASGILLLYLGRSIPAGIFLRTVLIGALYTAIAAALIFRVIKRLALGS